MIGFYARVSPSHLLNVTGDGTNYKVKFNNVFDYGGNMYDSTTGFTLIPSSGVYHVDAGLGMVGIDDRATNAIGVLQITTNSDVFSTYIFTEDAAIVRNKTDNKLFRCASATLYLEQGSTIEVFLNVHNTDNAKNSNVIDTSYLSVCKLF